MEFIVGALQVNIQGSTVPGLPRMAKYVVSTTNFRPEAALVHFPTIYEPSIRNAAMHA